MNKIELLAPAGNLEKAKIAILYGADAVYIGGKQFSLRSRASNFSIDEIAELVKFANAHNSHVHVTVNMLPHESDLDGIEEYLITLDSIGVHAIIVASPSIMMLAKSLDVSLKCMYQRSILLQIQVLQDSGKKRVWTVLFLPENVKWMIFVRFVKRIFFLSKSLFMEVCVFLFQDVVY